MSSKNDLCTGAKHNPELLGQYAALERKTGYTLHMSRKAILDIVFGTEGLQAAA
jgi:hypothetical protein